MLLQSGRTRFQLWNPPSNSLEQGAGLAQVYFPPLFFSRKQPGGTRREGAQGRSHTLPGFAGNHKRQLCSASLESCNLK